MAQTTDTTLWTQAQNFFSLFNPIDWYYGSPIKDNSGSPNTSVPITNSGKSLEQQLRDGDITSQEFLRQKNNIPSPITVLDKFNVAVTNPTLDVIASPTVGFLDSIKQYAIYFFVGIVVIYFIGIYVSAKVRA